MLRAFILSSAYLDRQATRRFHVLAGFFQRFCGSRPKNKKGRPKWGVDHLEEDDTGL